MAGTAVETPVADRAGHPLASIIPAFTPPPDGRVKGVVIAGYDSPDLIERIRSALPRNPDGYLTPIFLVEPDRDGPEAVGEGVHAFFGDGAIERFADACRERLTLTLPKHIVAGRADAQDLSRILASTLEQLGAEQQRGVASLEAVLRAKWAKRGLAHWKLRFTSIEQGDTARTLIVTSRYSTFVRYAAEDLAEAFRTIGHEARILIEPDEHALLTALHYLRELDTYDPDCIIAINYPRDVFGAALPEGWPYVCWVQDAMAHLFGGQQPKKGPLEFVTGHIYTHAMANAGYAPEAMLEHPVSVSGAKFHAGPASDAQRARFTCDIAYVSHRSQTPEQFHEWFMRESGFPTQAGPLLERCKREVERAIATWGEQFGEEKLAAASESLANALGRTGDGAFIELLRHQYVSPLSELIIRHQTLRWASEIVREEGLSFKLYGNGWDEHPELADFASGPIEHGDDLRACYQCAAVHLHASAMGSLHQRVFECALSGGVPLVRRSWDELFHHGYLLGKEFIERGLPTDAVSEYRSTPAYWIANHPDLMQMVRFRQRVRSRAHPWDHEWLRGKYAHMHAVPGTSYWDIPVPPEHARAISILGDPLELTFSTKADLRERILRGADRADWRSEVSSGLARRVRDAVGSEKFARRVLDLVASRLTA